MNINVTLGTNHAFLCDFGCLVYFLYCTSLIVFPYYQSIFNYEVDSLVSFCLISLCVHCMFAAKNIYILELLPNSEHEITKPQHKCICSYCQYYSIYTSHCFELRGQPITFNFNYFITNNLASRVNYNSCSYGGYYTINN